jgi:leader peptidase (prepilin peptidase)/N-methyltransferase
MIDTGIGIFLGLLAAILVNYLADVLPYYRRPVQPFCPHCKTNLPWSRYVVGRSCPQCDRPTWRLRHRITLLLVTAFSAWFWLHPSADVMPFENAIGWGRALSLVLTVFLALVIVIDIEHLVVLDEVSLFGALLAVTLGTWLHGWQTTLIGGLGGYLLMYALYGLGELYLRWRRRRAPDAIPADEVALGFGDVKLAGVLGLLLGWPDILLVLLLAFLVAGLFAIVSLIVLLARRENIAAAAMPYAPYLVLTAAWLLLF